SSSSSCCFRVLPLTAHPLCSGACGQHRPHLLRLTGAGGQAYTSRRPSRQRRFPMLDTPQIVKVAVRQTAVIRLTVPRAEIVQVMGPAICEVMATVAAQGLTPAGPVFSHHFRVHPEMFDFEVGVPVASPVSAAGRVKPGELPAATVGRTVYHGPYEGLE